MDNTQSSDLTASEKQVALGLQNESPRSKLNFSETLNWFKSRGASKVTPKYLFNPKEFRRTRDLSMFLEQIGARKQDEKIDVKKVQETFSVVNMSLSKNDVNKLFKVSKTNKKELNSRKLNNVFLDDSMEKTFSQIMKEKRRKLVNLSESDRFAFIPTSMSKMISYIHYNKLRLEKIDKLRKNDPWEKSMTKLKICQELINIKPNDEEIKAFKEKKNKMNSRIYNKEEKLAKLYRLQTRKRDAALDTSEMDLGEFSKQFDEYLRASTIEEITKANSLKNNSKHSLKFHQSLDSTTPPELTSPSGFKFIFPWKENNEKPGYLKPYYNFPRLQRDKIASNKPKLPSLSLPLPQEEKIDPKLLDLKKSISDLENIAFTKYGLPFRQNAEASSKLIQATEQCELSEEAISLQGNNKKSWKSPPKNESRKPQQIEQRENPKEGRVQKNDNKIGSRLAQEE